MKVIVLGQEHCSNCEEMYEELVKNGFDVVQADFMEFRDNEKVDRELRIEATAKYLDQNALPILVQGDKVYTVAQAVKEFDLDFL